jgi:hypothetical protein
MRLSENRLRNIIRNIILREGAVTPEQLDDNYTVIIKDNGIVTTPLKKLGRVDLTQRFGHVDPNTILKMPSYSIYLKYEYNNPKLESNVEEIFAELEMRKWDGMCNNAWEVYWADVHKDYEDGGFGPLMYDIAMELAGKHGLMCDRNSVSNEAARLWNHYLSLRSDVFADDINIDNCPSDMLSLGDIIAIRKGAEQPWHQKVYFSTNTVAGSTQPTINRLEKLGKIKRSYSKFQKE